MSHRTTSEKTWEIFSLQFGKHLSTFSTTQSIRRMSFYMPISKQKTTSSHYQPYLRELIRKSTGKCQRIFQLPQKSFSTPRTAWCCNLELADQPLWRISKDSLPLLASEQVYHCYPFQIDCPSTKAEKTILDVHLGKLKIFLSTQQNCSGLGQTETHVFFFLSAMFPEHAAASIDTKMQRWLHAPIYKPLNCRYNLVRLQSRKRKLYPAEACRDKR